MEGHGRKMSVEPIYMNSMLSQKTALEAMKIHSIHHRPDQTSEGLGDQFQFLVEGVLQDIVI